MKKKVGDDALKKKTAATVKIAASPITLPTKATRRSAVKKRSRKTVSSDAKPSDKVPETPLVVTEHVPSAVQVLAKRTPLVPLMPSPYRFPLVVDRAMSRVARISGVFFVILGAVFTLHATTALLQGMPTGAPLVQNNSQLAQVSDATNTTQSNVSSTTADLEPVFEDSMATDADVPLRGVVEVDVQTHNAHRVDVYMFVESWKEKIYLGAATQVSADRWVYAWDTTKVDSGKSYRLSAHVWNENTYTTSSNPDLVLQLEYMLVDNAPLVPVADPVEEIPVDETPDALLSAAATLTGDSAVTVNVERASEVTLVVQHVESGSRNYLYNARRVKPDEWLVGWRTTLYKDGAYTVRARIKNEYGTYVNGELRVTLENFVDDTPEETEEGVDETVDGIEPEAELPATTVTPPQLPTLRLRTSEGAAFDGTERVEADMSADVASHVYFYLRDPLSAVPRFVGAGIKIPGSTRWYTNWYTSNTPNGTYKLFARAITPPGPIDSQSVTITVANQVVSAATNTPTPETERISTLTNSLQEESETLKSPIEKLATVGEPAEVGSPSAEPAAPEAEVASLLRDYREALDAELIRLGTAYRLKDEAAVSRIRVHIVKLIDQMVASVPADTRDELRSRLQKTVDEIVTKYTAEVDRVSALIEKREKNDVLKDSDKDGVSDFDEVTLYNTNPIVADSDNDGFTDGAEILSGFDPLSDVRESVIAYESPKETGVFREDLLKIETVVAAPHTSATSSVSARTSILLEGRALPNSFVTLYIFSTPVIVTVKTDAEGAFAYRFDQELEDGQHSVYVGITDNAGRIVAKSQPFGFIKEAQAITPNQAAIVDNSAAAEADDSLMTGYAFAAIVSISVVAIGLVLILLGLQLEARRRKIVPGEAMITPAV